MTALVSSGGTVIATTPASSNVNVSAGSGTLNGSAVSFSGNATFAVIPPSSNSQYMVVVVDSSGTLHAFDMNTYASDGQGNYIPLARIYFESGINIATSSNISDIRPLAVPTPTAGTGTVTNQQLYRSNYARQDFAMNNGGAAGNAARNVPLSQIQYEVFDAKAAFGVNSFQLAVPFNGYIWQLPYGVPGSSIVATKILLYNPTYSNDPFQDTGGYQTIDLAALTGSAYAGGFLGACSLNGKLYLCPSFAVIGGQIQSSPVFFVYDSGLGPPTSAAAWSTFDIYQGGNGPVPQLAWCGWAACCTDGTYIYFAGVKDYNTGIPHGTIVRYDSRLAFGANASWSGIRLNAVIDTHLRGYQGCTFDGTYVWFAQTDNGVDGGSYIARWDTRKTDFSGDTDSGWAATDITALSFSNAANCTGFVGCFLAQNRYLMLVPYKTPTHAVSPGVSSGWVTRLDTKHPAAAGALGSSSDAWATINLETLSARAGGYQGGASVGGYSYLCPTNHLDGSAPPLVRWNEEDLRFTNTAAWEALDLSPNMPWSTYFAYDGNEYLYSSPLLENGGGTSGRIYRFRVGGMNPGEATNPAGRSTSLWFDETGAAVFGAREQATNNAQVDVIGAMHATSLIRTDVTLQEQVGSSGAYANAMALGGSHTGTVGNSAGSLTTLDSYNIPANSPSVNGAGLKFVFWGTSATNGDTNKRILLTLGPNGSPASVFDITFTNNAANARWRLEGTIVRISAGNYAASAQMANQAGTCVAQSSSITADETQALLLVLSGNGTTGSDIVWNGSIWEFFTQ